MHALKILVIGPFPPPVHGASTVTQAVANWLEESGMSVRRLSVAPATPSRGWRWHAQRALAYSRAAAQVIQHSRSEVLYIALSGGLGLAYDFGLVLVARLTGIPLCFHHHSYAYLHQRSLLMAALIRVAGARQTHIVLGTQMAGAIKDRYGRGVNLFVASNLAFLEFEAAVRTSPQLRRIGLIANLSLAKGLDRFLEVAKMIAPLGIAADIAGPFSDDESRDLVELHLKTSPTLAYHGPLYGREKALFLSNIDLFVFPTRYQNEAEPLVILEAMAHGLPIAATKRGCVPDMVVPSMSVLLDPDAADLSPLLDQIQRWHDAPATFSAASRAAAAHFAELSKEGRLTRRRLLPAILQCRLAPREHKGG